METNTEHAILAFIHDELCVLNYTDPGAAFSDAGIESFQVLEILLEVERQIGRRVSVKQLSSDSLFSLRVLLANVAGNK